jgi:FkbM family methyltransferase
MHILERFCTTVRHSRGLRNAEWLWSGLRAPYTTLLATVSKNGLARVINGTDAIRLMPEHRAVAESYEPEVWKRVMDEARLGDVVVDVGANIGLYTIALAKRVGDGGKVHAFEPDPANFRALDRHCHLNQVTARIVAHQVAVAGADARVAFESGRGAESRISRGAPVSEVDGVRLDSVFAGNHIDILKIDVEGFEEEVLKGASALLSDRLKGPRVIFIEVHPFAWGQFGTTSETLLKLLADHGYCTEDLSGKVVPCVERYGEIVARRHERRTDNSIPEAQSP